MFARFDSEFIDFKSQHWKNVVEILSERNNLSDQNVLTVIEYLQNTLWRTTIKSIIHPSKINIEEFVDYFKWASEIILELPKTFPQGLSEYFKQKIIRLNKFQCLSILASMFFSCTHKVHTFLDEREQAKYSFLMTYFRIMRGKTREELESEEFIIEKKVLDQDYSFKHWKNSELKLKKLQVDEERKIEDFDDKFLKVDFANMYIGGGVLNFGCVQEEILFVIYPEMLVSMFFCKPMKENEAIVLRGARRVARYTGYAWSLKFAEEYTEPQDPSINTFTAIDALMFPSFRDQFSDNLMIREINKAYIGFSQNSFDDPSNLQPVVTGKWGCGEFGGFAPLKALLMWIAASAAGRDMIMTTFKDRTLKILSDVGAMYEGSTISELIDLIHNNVNADILEFLIQHKKNPGSVAKVQVQPFIFHLPPVIKNNFNLQEKHASHVLENKNDVKHSSPNIKSPEDLMRTLETKKIGIKDEDKSKQVDSHVKNVSEESKENLDESQNKDSNISKDESVANNREESKENEKEERLQEESKERAVEELKETKKVEIDNEILSGRELMQGQQIIEETNDIFMDIDKTPNTESKTEKANLPQDNPEEKTSNAMDLDTQKP